MNRFLTLGYLSVIVGLILLGSTVNSKSTRKIPQFKQPGGKAVFTDLEFGLAYWSKTAEGDVLLIITDIDGEIMLIEGLDKSTAEPLMIKVHEQAMDKLCEHFRSTR